MQTNTNILALDVGGSRIGVAIASYAARLPRPHSTVENSEDVFDKLQEIITSEDVGMVVVGYPRNMDGQSTAQTVEIEDFVREFQKHIFTPTAFQDESLTSRYAEDELAGRGVPYSKGDIDALAATYILQDYINENGAKL